MMPFNFKSARFCLLLSALSAPSLAHASELSAYIGLHPANPLNGTSFLDDKRVVALVEDALSDPSLRALVLAQTRDHAFSTSLFESQGRIAFNAYDPSPGSMDNWGISIAEDGSDGAVCLALNGSGDFSPPGEWYRAGQLIGTSPDGCPQDAAALARAFGG
ncbi:hypothetical protein HOY34_10995 [Xinfangfangia sp. D13-10-4-6]|uniref:hypothetical protein n=1 Tax=Pseudogemmobacter hezensis TaxID=2737662 RepID=UPI001552DD38|nr:hypothetical protein [Pseudogemmobacter hezensis]NPD15728.1 hypothetical protein [Pseudogemmobacter hezensis]